jgi:chromosome segregation ATPase
VLIAPPMLLYASTDLPVVDDTTPSVSAQSLVSLLAHFEPFADGPARSDRSLLSRICGSVRFVPSQRAQGIIAEDHAPISIIRRVALGMATKTKALEREVAATSSAAWAEKEEAKTLIADLQATHAQISRLEQEKLESERRRVASLETEVQQQATQIRRLEEELSTLSQSKMRLESDHIRSVRELESQQSHLQHQLAVEREKSQLAYTLAVEERDAKLNQCHRRLTAMTEENEQLQQLLRRKTSDLASLERGAHEHSDAFKEIQRSLEQSQTKNSSMLERIRVLEGELHEHRQYSHKSVFTEKR